MALRPPRGRRPKVLSKRLGASDELGPPAIALSGSDLAKSPMCPDGGAGAEAAGTDGELKAMLATPPAAVEGVRDRAMPLLELVGAFRRSELVGLDVEALASTPGGLSPSDAARSIGSDPVRGGRFHSEPISRRAWCGQCSPS